jgi:hypothetical protein
VPVYAEVLQRVGGFIERGNGSGRHRGACAIETVCADGLTGSLEPFADSEDAVDDDGVDAFSAL